MGEFIRLSYEERKRVLKIVVEKAAAKPILAGAAEPNVDLVLEMCRYCADLGCRAVSITGPYHSPACFTSSRVAWKPTTSGTTARTLPR